MIPSSPATQHLNSIRCNHTTLLCTALHCTALVGRLESLLHEGLREGAERVREGQGARPPPHGAPGRVLQHPVCEGEEGRALLSRTQVSGEGHH